MKDDKGFNYVDTDSVLISNLTPEQIKQAKEVINSFYGTSAGVLQTVPQIVDCDFCRNANTCDELQHDNDLSYMSCGNVDNGFRMLFRSGDKRKTELIVEQLGEHGWETIGVLTPNNCPFCGRPLYENTIKYKIHKRGL